MARTQKETVKNEQEETVIAESKYSKEQILSSATFTNCHDMLDALLAEGKEYTVEEVNNIMDGWRKKGVK